MRFELDLRINGIFEAETPYNRTTSPHLYAWFQTSEAMIMLLSNDSIQVYLISYLFNHLEFVYAENYQLYSR